MRKQKSVSIIIVSCLLIGTIAGIAQADAIHWWDDFPLIINNDSVSTAQSYNASVSFNGSYNAPSWGPYALKSLGNQNTQNAFENAGFKTISYYETFGQSYCFIAEIGTNTGNGAPLLNTHWSWGNYGGGTATWVGAPDFFDDKDYAQPYTRTHPQYGGLAMTYPDGTIATGSNGSPSDPRNSRVFDAGCSKNILGVLSREYEVRSSAPFTGLVQEGANFVSLFLMHKDSACPKWIEMDRATVKYSAAGGLNGMWTDNFGPWDSLNAQPVERAFGDWSVARFRDYLADNFTPSELSAMGVSNVSTFDIRAALRAQTVSWGGIDTNLSDAVWRSTNWQDQPLWRAYLIFKRQTGTEALST